MKVNPSIETVRREYSIAMQVAGNAEMGFYTLLAVGYFGNMFITVFNISSCEFSVFWTKNACPTFFVPQRFRKWVFEE